MKRILKRSITLILALSFILMQALQISASQTTSYTFTLDDRNEFVRTQDAYLPDRTVTNLELSEPADIAIDDNNNMYIADTGNKRIVVYNIDTEEKFEIKLPEFQTPKGVYVSDTGELYVADSQAQAVFKLDKDYNLIQTYGRPTAPIFSDANYDPGKVTVDLGGCLYIVCESNNTGIVQIANTGEFLGYFASNKTVLSAKQLLLKAIYTKEQELKSEELNTAPTVFSNVCIDNAGVIYSVSMNGVTSIARADMVKKHSTNGTNMFAETGVLSENHSTDITVDESGIIYVADDEGYIQVYTKSGEMIFFFGAQNMNADIAGVYSALSTIALDKDGNIWTADRDKGYIQSFVPTDYATTIYKALDLYENGEYEQSLTQWNKVLRLNQMSVLAHNGVGKAYFHAGDYEAAMEHFEIAGNRGQYSEAYWEVRSKQLSDNLPIFAAVIVVLIILRIAYAIGDRKKALTKKKRALSKKLKNTPVIGELGYAFKIARHPIDRYYDIRVGKNGSTVAATVMYVIFFITFMIYQIGKGFIFQYTDIEDMDISAVVVGFFAILFLFIICNYLVTSINDGDGTFKQIYMIPAYGLVPLWISMIAVVFFSYFLTYNEVFLLYILLYVGVGWTLVLIFQGLATVHDYTFKDTVLSLVLTFLFMLVAAVVVVIVIIMWNQLWDFMLTVGKELIRNVTTK